MEKNVCAMQIYGIRLRAFKSIFQESMERTSELSNLYTRRSGFTISRSLSVHVLLRLLYRL